MQAIQLRAILALIAFAMAGVPLRAQFTQESQIGAGAARGDRVEERARSKFDNSRWQFGRLRVDPLLEVRNAGFFANVFAASGETDEETDEFRATAGAGLTASIGAGSKSFVSGFVAPEYTWWQDSEELRQFNVNYGLGWFGYYNRVTVALDVFSTERERPLSAELDIPVQVLDEGARAQFEVILQGRVSLVGSAISREIRNSREVEEFVDGVDLSKNDLDTERSTLGLSFKPGKWRISAGVERTRAEFLDPTSMRSNEGTSPFAAFEFVGNSFLADLEVVRREFEFDNEAFEPKTATVVRALAEVHFGPRTRLSVYQSRGVSPAIRHDLVLLTDRRTGISASYSVGRRLGLTIFGEAGELDFGLLGTSARQDDLEASGARLDFDVTERVVFSLRAESVDWDSNLNEFDRSTERIGLGLEFAGNLLPW